MGNKPQDDSPDYALRCDALKLVLTELYAQYPVTGLRAQMRLQNEVWRQKSFAILDSRRLSWDAVYMATGTGVPNDLLFAAHMMIFPHG